MCLHDVHDVLYMMCMFRLRRLLAAALSPITFAACGSCCAGARSPEVVRRVYGKMGIINWIAILTVQGVNHVIVALGSNFKPGVGKTAKLDSALGCAGDPAAFENFARMMRAKMLWQSSTASASVTANGKGSDGSDDSSPSSVAANKRERKRRRATSNSKDSRNPELSFLLSINESH